MLRTETNLASPTDDRSEAGSFEMPEFGISAGTYFLPPARRQLEDWAAAIGPGGHALLPAMRTNGLAHYHVATDMNVEELCVAAVERLLSTSGKTAKDIDMVIYCHTNATSVMAAPASIPAVLQKRFGMDRAIGFSVSQQNCASIVCALRLLKTLMWRHKSLKEVLIVSADKVFGERYRNVSSYAIQSDGSLALWISRDEQRNRIGHISYKIDGRYYKGSAKGPELAQRFALNYAFTAHQMMAEVIRESNWSKDEVDAVLPMNANLTAFSKVIELLGLPIEKLYTKNVGAMGHVFCCDPFVNFLDRFSDASTIGNGNAVLFASSSSGVFSAVGISNSQTWGDAKMFNGTLPPSTNAMTAQ